MFIIDTGLQFLFFCAVFVWFWYQGDGGFEEWVWKCFFLCNFLKKFIYCFKFYFIFKLYIIVLVLPNIKMNPSQVYMFSHTEPSYLLPPHTIPLDCPSALAPSIQYHASNLDWQLVSYMILYMFQCHSPKSSHRLPLPQSP